MSCTAPSLDAVLDVIETLEPPGTPLTTREVAGEFDCTARTIYNKLEALVDEDVLKTKKVGARGRVWWRPARERGRDGASRGGTGYEVAETDRRARQQLQEERDMFADGPAVVFRWDPDAEEGWPVDYVSENVEDVFGYTPEELESGEVPYSDLLLEEEIDRIAREVAEHSDETTERFSHEPYRIETKDGDHRWVEDITKIVRDETGDITNYLGYLLDITERKHTQAALVRLNDVSRELMNADTREVSDRAPDITGNVLDVEYTAFWRYEGTSGELERYSTHTDPETDPDAVHLPDGFANRIWQTFVGNDVDVCNHFGASEKASSGCLVRSAVLIPLGRHGVICAGTTRTKSFDEREVDLAETVAATIEAALDRAEGEERLADQNEELHRLDELNSLIRGIDKALVEADSLEAIDRAVCERLTNSDHFEFAWIGERDPGTDAITPREWAGIDCGYLENLTITVDETAADDPIATAAQTGELQVVADVAIDPRVVAWRESTLERGARSCISIPLVYDSSVYGVLTVYIDYPQPDERYHAVLEELGETIAHAIDATETKQALLTDSVTEVTLKTRDSDGVLADLAARAGCEIEFDGLVPQRDGAVYLFFTAQSAAAEDVLAAATQLPGIAEIKAIRNEEAESVFGAVITGSTLVSHIVNNQGIVHSLTVTDEATTAVVNLPTDATVREFVEAVQIAYPNTELVARRTCDRPIKTRHDLRDALEERLTDRQREILKTAYMSGFFESPRARTGQQLSEALDITQSTFSHHLREAERRLCGLAFEDF